MYLTNKNEDSMRLHEVLPQYSVVVLTPAVLLSHLCGHKPLLPGGICAFTLILFDECHHARKDGSYSDVMYYYMKEKRMRRNLPQASSFQSIIEKKSWKCEYSYIKIIFSIQTKLPINYNKLHLTKKKKKPLPSGIPDEKLQKKMFFFF